MAAILPYLETEPHSDAEAVAGFGDVTALRRIKPEHALSKSHTELTKLAWGRNLIAKALVGRAFSLEDDNGVIYVRVKPGIPSDVVPWHKSGGESLDRFQLFSTNSKMQVPTFDLPSGVYGLGGSCPGARWAQSSVEPEERRLDSAAAQYASKVVGHALHLNTAVCAYCYASGGKYGEVVVQFAETARFAFVRTMMSTPEGLEKLKGLLSWVAARKLKWRSVD